MVFRGRGRQEKAAMENQLKKSCDQVLARRVDAIFFDLDNTLVETRRADEQTCKEVRHDIFPLNQVTVIIIRIVNGRQLFARLVFRAFFWLIS